ncbi:hypothetical protein F7734_16315 [Scytonema sp. UIC 10036]|uniref:hypothetical protein n=1 Tax=Scytonema sp. UIC 10036 TaxID=2304196 RepID=UPI0012DA1FB6|nr:hypothetical protein [Scytonema sp. UIC 10036]MUG93885.1 hypothetical protein [Scytonema sp. UIC 10036]
MDTSYVGSNFPRNRHLQRSLPQPIGKNLRYESICQSAMEISEFTRLLGRKVRESVRDRAIARKHPIYVDRSQSANFPLFKQQLFERSY